MGRLWPRGIHTISEELFGVGSGFWHMRHQHLQNHLPCFALWTRSLTIQQNPGLRVAWSLIPNKGQTPLLDLWIMKPKMKRSEALDMDRPADADGKIPALKPFTSVGLHTHAIQHAEHLCPTKALNELQEALPSGRPLSETLAKVMIDKVTADNFAGRLAEESNVHRVETLVREVRTGGYSEARGNLWCRWWVL